jgi:pimeloyl-ACP methyl ester carboxylesterase
VNTLITRSTPIVLVLCAILLAAVSPTGIVRAREQAQGVPRFETATCPDSLADLAYFRCGYLIVDEDHQQPNGKTIQLMVAIARSTSESPAPDPVLALSGGPGLGAVGVTATSPTELAIREHRDIIYLDQRGTGHSIPSLQCPTTAATILNNVGGDRTHTFRESMVNCRDSLMADGVNLEVYTSAQSAADIEALRKTLGYVQINLWGGSYGTRLALTVIRDFPTGIRSAVLNAVYPPAVDIYRDSPKNTDRVFRILFDQCVQDWLCNLLYPDLRETFIATYERLNKEPAQIPITDPSTGLVSMLTLSGDGFAAGVSNLLYDSPAIRYLPALIYAIRDGDYSIVQEVIRSSWSVGQALSYGMFFSVQCGEEAPFSTDAEIDQAGSEYPAPMRLYEGIFSARMHKLCEVWPTAPAKSIENAPVAGDMPVLLLAGEHDPVTPPAWARLAAQTLPHSYVYEFPGVGHGVISSGSCPAVMATEFLDDPYHAPDSTCIGQMTRFGYVITAPATRPVARVAALIFGVSGIGLLLVGAWLAIRRYQQLTWRISRRLVTWLPVLISVLVILLPFVSNFEAKDKLRLVELAIPAAAAVTAALSLAPADDQTLEVLMACPRPPMWLPLERILLPLGAYSLIAVAGSIGALLVTGESNAALTLVRWIPPTVMLSGIALYVTVRSRQMVFGALLTLLIWGGAIILSDGLLPGHITIFPLNYLQPFLWIFHPFLQPDSLTLNDYLLNRIVVTGVGLAFLAWALWSVGDIERLLFGHKALKARVS